MKYVEVSKKIRLTKEASGDDLKRALLERFRRAFDVTKVEESKEGFKLVGATGSKKSLTRHAEIEVDVTIAKNQEHARSLYMAARVRRAP